jgi:prepilin-type processing-associated H-X9-DG protein
MYLNQHKWHMPAWWGSAPPANDPHAYNAYNRYWGGWPEFRKALGMPILPSSYAYTCYVTKKWYCPKAVKGLTPANPDPTDRTNELYYPLHFAYGMNVMGVDIPTETGSNSDVWNPRATQADPALPANMQIHAFKPGQVRHGADKIHFADAMYFVINVYGVGPNNGVYPGWHNRKSNYDLIGESTETESNGNGINSQRTIAWRHKKGANVVFFDGHGEWVPKTRLYKTDASGNIVRNDAIWNVMD